MGSEIAFEDLRGFALADFEFEYLKEGPCGDGLDCWVVEAVPTYARSGYRRQVAWIDQVEFRLVQIEYYDRKRALLKTTTYFDHTLHGDLWRPATVEIVNHQTGKSTTLLFKDPVFQVGLKKGDFAKKKLGVQ